MIFMSKFVFSVIIDYMALNSKQILISFWNPFQSVQHTVNILKPLCAKKGEQYKTYIHSLPNPTGASVCYCSVSTCRDIKEEAMRRALQWFRDPVRQDDKKSPSALEREGKKKQNYAVRNTHLALFSVNAAHMGRWWRLLHVFSWFLLSLQKLPLSQSLGREICASSLPRHPCLSVPCGVVVIEITVCLNGSDNRYPGATGTWCLIN